MQQPIDEFRTSRFSSVRQSFSIPGHPRSRILSMRCLRSAPGAFCDYHSHPFPEFTLVTDDSTMNGCAEGKLTSLPNTLYLFLPENRMDTGTPADRDHGSGLFILLRRYVSNWLICLSQMRLVASGI